MVVKVPPIIREVLTVGEVIVGDVASTTLPEPVDEAEIAMVPDEVIGEPDTDMKDGTVIATDVTVPVVGVVQVIGLPPPAEVRTCPEVPAVAGNSKL